MHLKLPYRILFLRILSGSFIMFERLTEALWRIVLFLAFFASLWLLQIPSILGGFGEALALLIFIGGVGFLVYRDVPGFRIPSLRDIDRRIEKDSAVKGRPLTGLRDRLVNPQAPGARDLWAKAKFRLTALLRALRPAKLRAVMSDKDPYALRFVVFMMLILGIISAGPDWRYRIQDGLTPFSFGPFDAEQREHYTLWITPPEYTRGAQLILNEKTTQDTVLKIPQGSVLKAIVHRGWGAPVLDLGETRHAFTSSADKSYGLEVNVPAVDQDLALKQGFRTLASWPYETIADTPPSITLEEDTPNILENGELRFSLSVKDDYGVEYLDMSMRLDDIVEDAPLGDSVLEQRLVVSPAGQDFDIAPVYDLTSHLWAGLPAVITFTARDHIDQSTALESIRVTLPEREFRHPVAKTLVALRKKLAWQPESNQIYAETAYDLEVLLTAKEMLHNDVVAYLGIRSAASRLEQNIPSIKIAREVMDLMWDTALRVEDGDLTLAARNLEDAQQALEDALNDPNISDEEIAALMNELREAMAEYFSELAREMEKRAQNGEEMPFMSPEMMTQSLNPDALADFLNQLEDMMRSGDKSAAQQMLSQMQRLMDMLNPSMRAQMPSDMQMMEQGINELEELIKRQEALLEQTRKQAKIMGMLGELGFDYGEALPTDPEVMDEWSMEGMPPAPGQNGETPDVPFVNTQANKAEQEALRYILGQLMLAADDKIGEIPPGMALAEQEMRGSSGALGENKPQRAVPHQELALEHLKDAQEQLAQQLQQRMQQMTGFMIGFGSRQMQYDPLGRPYGGPEGPNGESLNSNVKVPDDAERRRVQEILQLLRRRAGELDRPRPEIEYYRRLLKRF